MRRATRVRILHATSNGPKAVMPRIEAYSLAVEVLAGRMNAAEAVNTLASSRPVKQLRYPS